MGIGFQKEKDNMKCVVCKKGKAKVGKARFKWTLVKARIRKNGVIRYRTRDFNSPSQAASAVVKRAANGWYFWKYERAPGDWVSLTELPQ
jgi:hypothetical protein